MVKAVFCFVGFATLASLLILVKPEEILALQMPNNEGAPVYNANNMVQLIMVPKDSNVPRVSEFKVCRTQMCISEVKGNSEDADLGKQASIRDTTGNKNHISHEDKKCICRSNEAVLFIVQDVKELPGQHFVKYRVQEIHENVCRAEVCDWTLAVFTSSPKEHGGNNDVIGCISGNTGMVVRHVKRLKLLRSVYSFTALAVTVVLSIMSVLSCITLRNCMISRRTYPGVQGRDRGLKSTKHLGHLPPFLADFSDNVEDYITSDDETEMEDNEVDYQRYFPIHDRLPEQEPAHLKYQMRI